VTIWPASRWRLDNPDETRAAPVQELAETQPEAMSLAQLRELARETEIDFAELVGNVNNAIAASATAASPSISVAQVLERFPASQGVASVVGLLVLATQQGKSTQQRELIHWKTKLGSSRVAMVEKWEFYRKVKL
jgi:hypothetical protein